MAGKTIARVAWDLPNGEERVHWMSEDESVDFGRAPECQIQVGRTPYDDKVPNFWGRLTWGGRLRVENVAVDTAKWSFSLHPVTGTEIGSEEGPCVVPPGREASLAQPQFEVRARAPGGLGIDYVIRVNAFRLPSLRPITAEPPSIITVTLSEAERRIGRALIAPLENGSAVPATVESIASLCHYSKDGARDVLERIDAKLASAGLYIAGPSGRTPDRVARVLLDQRALLG